MSVRSKLTLLLALIFQFSSALLAARAEEATEKSAEEKTAPTFLRIHENASGKPDALQTAIVRYADPQQPGVYVDLVGAVHIGEQAYYDQLNEEFKNYDALLYEIVAPKGTRIPKGGPKKNGSAVSGLQNGMKDMLGLEFQLEQIDYTPQNFVHADMSPEEMAADMAERGDGFLQMFARLMGAGMVQQTKGEDMNAAMLMALFADDRQLRMKRLFASQMDDMEGQMRAIEGKNGSTLISQRNAKAFQVLRQELNDGKKKIGVFYGAGHFADMHRRLVEDFGLQPQSTRWLNAWDLTK
ncbi:hypothetical protein LOC68_26585 [Blastopirellula sp. JC732]|uniref:TraB/GumN family protein n=1 Tax=Blastopirellula sediminis TaxID=2894196 RepID=A0A9X1SMS2_9BACT|nr:hypothetical protein [Blastopirellula sediminis]MCC9604722.1 hypothetical protein [Blastopirellula sediminis]MCC9631979.1 hypothetical protein [Blastopirellula sediminis]